MHLSSNMVLGAGRTHVLWSIDKCRFAYLLLCFKQLGCLSTSSIFERYSGRASLKSFLSLFILYHQTAKEFNACTLVYVRIYSRFSSITILICHLCKWTVVVCEGELYFPIAFVSSSESTTAPPESSNIGAIAGVAVGSVTIISISVIVIVIIVTRSHRARFDLRKEER